MKELKGGLTVLAGTQNVYLVRYLRGSILQLPYAAVCESKDKTKLRGNISLQSIEGILDVAVVEQNSPGKLFCKS